MDNKQRNRKGASILTNNIKLLNLTVHKAHEEIFWINKNGKILYANETACKALGYAEDEILCESFTNIDVRFKKETWLDFLNEIRKKGKLNYESVYLTKDNREFPVEIFINYYKIVDKEFVTAFCLDITQRKDTEKKLEQAILNYEDTVYDFLMSNMRLEKEIVERKAIEEELINAQSGAIAANKAKSEFLANMSHEIRTPLNAVLGFAEILKEKLGDNEEYLEFIEGINTGGQSLLSLINDILDLSKIEAGKLQIQKEPINPNQLLKEVKQIFLQKSESKGLELDLIAQDIHEGALFMDNTRIRQILFNLVGNAIKFTSVGKVSVRIILEGEVQVGKAVDVIFEVEDTGMGIPVKQQKLIFEPFIQKEGQSTSKFGGTGLGLAITKRLVEMMNGSIFLESRINHGSKFTVKLNNVKLIESRDIKIISGEIATKKIDFYESKILLVEDSGLNRKVFLEYLREFNFRIIEAENGLEALKLLELHTPDIIFMDLRMPEMDGFEAAQKVRENVEYRLTPIILLSASVIKNYSKDEISLFNDTLLKPVTKQKIIETLVKHLPHSVKSVTPEEASKKLEVKNYHDELIETDLSNITEKEKLLDSYQIMIMKKQKEMVDYIDIDEIKVLAENMIKFSQKYRFDIFKSMGEELKKYCKSFQMKQIEKILQMLPIFENKIKNELKVNK